MLDKYNTVLVTGGAGFIGSHLCEELLNIGKRVIIIDNLSTGKRENIPTGTDFIELDLDEFDGVQQVLNNAEIVFHVAAQPSTRKSLEDPDLDFNSNVRGTFNLLKAALEAEIKRFIYTSSSAVYGEPKHLPVTETDYPTPNTPYGASKLCGEIYALMFMQTFGLPVTCIRPFNVYGPRENIETTLDEVILYSKAILNKKPIVVYGEGNQSRDFVYVKDVANAHILAAERDESLGKVLNIGTGIGITINALLQEIEAVTGNRAIIQHEPWPSGEIYRQYSDISLSSKLLKYSPKIKLREGIEKIIESFNN